MICSKLLTLSLIYATNDNVAEQLKTKINNIMQSKEFDNEMCIVTKELLINIEQCNNNKVELFITMFTTLTDKTIKLGKLIRSYISNNLTEIFVDNVRCKLIRKIIY